MLYPKIPYNEWAERYNISTKCVNCACGYLLKLNKPIALKGYRGLEAEVCPACHEISGIMRLVPVDEDTVSL